MILDYQHLALQVKNRAQLGHVAEAGGLIEDVVREAVAAARGSTVSVSALLDAQVIEIKTLRAERDYLRAAVAERDATAAQTNRNPTFNATT